LVLSDSDWTFPIPEDISFEEAATHYLTPWTCHFMMEEVKKGGHKACISTAASSSLGKMLVKKCKKEGIELVNIVRGEHNVKKLQAVGAQNILNQEDENFEADLKKICLEKNPTLCFDAVAGDLTKKILPAMPEHSTLWIYGAMQSHLINDIMVSDLLFGERSLVGFWLYPRCLRMQPDERAKIAQQIFSELKDTLKTDVSKVFGLENFKEAIQYSQDKKTEGKVLLKP